MWCVLVPKLVEYIKTLDMSRRLILVLPVSTSAAPQFTYALATLYRCCTLQVGISIPVQDARSIENHGDLNGNGIQSNTVAYKYKIASHACGFISLKRPDTSS
jgi:hypothetical protein